MKNLIMAVTILFSVSGFANTPSLDVEDQINQIKSAESTCIENASQVELGECFVTTKQILKSLKDQVYRSKIDKIKPQHKKDDFTRFYTSLVEKLNTKVKLINSALDEESSAVLNQAAEQENDLLKDLVLTIAKY